MADLIFRKAALEAIDRERGFLIENKMYGAEHIVVHYARRIIEDLPSVEAIPVEWIMKWSNKRFCETRRDVSIVDVLEAWQKEREATP